MKGHITRPFLRLALHGMVNRKAGDFDFAIAGARNVADERILEWFEKQLTEKINSQSELVVDSGQKPKVVIAIPEDDKTKVFAGRNIGLATLRMETRGHIIQHPNFGPGFSTIQLEISNRIRTDKSKREILANILAEILRKFPNEFPQL